VLFVGRLVEEKDPLTMVEAFRLALLRNPAIRFEVVGNGYLKDKTAQFIRLHGLDHRITLIPALPDVRPYLRRAHVFVLPSQREASPNVILEAMATGLPVISTRVGGIPELVQDRETGRLIEPKDPQALAAAILELVANQPLREAMGAKARERVMRRHTIAGMVNATERILTEVMEDAAQVS
jgi:glycosyltransferase involved in cell wall biosynthesis